MVFSRSQALTGKQLSVASRRPTALFLDHGRRAENLVIDPDSARGVVRSVQALVFAQLREDLGRAHGVAPLVEAEPVVAIERFDSRCERRVH